MGCSGEIQFFQRPYVYDRRPFKLAVNQEIPYSGVYYSQPAYAALTDKRLFTDAENHPVATPILLYVNKDTATTIPIEPLPDASGYPSGCIDYVDYITDMRDVLDDVYTLQAADSDFDEKAFLISHLRRNRESYGDLNVTTASGTLDDEYIHSTPATMFPSGEELGTSGVHDIDVDEVSYQPMARPSKFAFTSVKTSTRRIPTSPLFPIVVKKGGGIPSISTLTAIALDALGLDVSSSGNKILVTGDRLVQDTAIKAMTANSGSAPIASGNFFRNIDGAAYPAQDEMCRYIEASGAPSGFITASGRQALFDPPTISDTGVYLVAISEDTEVSGQMVQYFPTNWNSLEGVFSSGTRSHRGLYVEEKLLYTTADFTDSQMAIGRSLNTGRKLFGNITDPAKNALGKGLSARGDVGYIDNNKVYVHADTLSQSQVAAGTDRFGNAKFETNSELSWATANTVLEATFETGNSTDLQLTHGLRAWGAGNILGGGSFGIQLIYIQWGVIDYFVRGNSNTSTPGFVVKAITYTTRSFDHADDAFGNPILVERPESPEIVTDNITVFPQRYAMDNIFTNLFSRNFFKGLVNVNGDLYYQWGDNISSSIIRRGRILSLPSNFTDQLVPASSRTVVTVAIGFFPNWALRTYITENNQTEIPDRVGFSSFVITNATGMDKFADNDVNEYGPPVWDSSANVSYLYVKLNGAVNGSAFWFCTMDTSLEIIDAKPVFEEDVILEGPAGLLSL
jgi:hypothetical protein